MRPLLKGLIVCLTLLILLAVVRSSPIAQADFEFPSLWDVPSFLNQPLQVSTREKSFIGEGDILVDDFEYSDSPYNHGWIGSDVYGGGYTKTLMDSQIGSRVLDMYRPRSEFIVYTPDTTKKILYNLFTPPGANNPHGESGISMDTNPVLSFDFTSLLNNEPWDLFFLDVIGEDASGDRTINVTVKIGPLEPPCGASIGSLKDNEGIYDIRAAVTGFNPTEQLHVTVTIDRGMLDGSWHAVHVDLVEAVKAAVDVFNDIDDADKSGWFIARANSVVVRGWRFRLDNLMFRVEAGRKFLDAPDLFEMGPLYALIFEPYRYLFIADSKGTGITVYDKNGQACVMCHVSKGRFS